LLVHKDLERPGGVTRLGPGDGSVTAKMKTNFLNGEREEDILCRAKVLKLGRRLIYGVGECRHREGKLLTHSTITYIRAD